ncbi:CoA pyrophosphatase [Tepidimonas taiwanensis]|uniref:Putative Nudix hydrolase NudL n=1 Tax=Tepidimonas taiwanensis TaxID=307486 RepID=A0A554XD50_9BURK|nr:CoA pyrophosphatase [Tepidimonas taiwanensis]MCX7692220.1 CoA pyrophosphatase [Tepidimonas taiwanensis]TSE33756.1 putative Nudix hydrolase NudL [Tepidimonas taiwanensis]UBQ06697.1 CoA pyrophosphatase [Tepidimonas taiwanensis]
MRPPPAPPPAFDPRQVPVVARDDGLPPVPVEALDPATLRGWFAAPPPWTPEIRAEPRWVEGPATPAAVLVPLVWRARPTVLLTQRTAHLPTHAGQVAFPGGKLDACDDGDPVRCALREAAEEVGVAPAWVEPLGTLPVYATGSGFHITPVVALVRPQGPWRPNPQEVADAFEVPLAFLMDPRHHRHHELDVGGVRRRWLSMPYDDGGVERYIWGATAAMLRNLYRFFVAAGAIMRA